MLDKQATIWYNILVKNKKDGTKTMIMKQTTKEFTNLFNQAIKVERYQIANDNSAKNIRCYKAVIARLESLPQDVMLTAESAMGKAERPFDLPNIGSLMECVVKAMLDGCQASEYAKEFNDDNADTKIGWCEYEIKSSMGAVSLNTKIKGDKPILFINELGVFSIKKTEIDNYTKKGKLPYNKAVGKQWLTLSKKLGYEM
jgi:hypothetical protein